MSDTLNEALTSRDAEFIKRARTIYKGKHTRAAKVLVQELRKDGSQKFLFDDINENEVSSMLTNLQKSKDIVEELHVRYTLMRSRKEGSEEDKLEEADEAYAEGLENTHREALKVYHAYTSQLKTHKEYCKNQESIKNEHAQYPEKLRCFKAKMAEYDSAFLEASTVIESEDESLQRTASLQKDMLMKDYGELLSMGQELLALHPGVVGASDSDKESFECSKVKLTYRKTLTSLELVIRKVEASDKEKLAKVAPAPFISSEVRGTSSVTSSKDSNVLKIKVSAPKFSGKSREFAVFKRDFNSIVAVENRSPVEIGALLKESIPSDYKYLLDKFELGDHVKMMAALTEKFGRARIIIDECTAELKRMHKINSDSEFIKFVDHLDKLKRDLNQLGLLSDIANTTVISEIETKLPPMVQRDWIKLASAKEMSDKSSSEIFECLLTFLEDTKRQAEYFGTEVRQIGGNQAKASTKLGFVNCGTSNTTDTSQKVKEPARNREPLPCLACCDGSTDLKAAIHPTNTCDVWKSLTYNQKREKVNCVYHPAKGLKGDHTTAECKVGKAKCDICKDSNNNGHKLRPKPKPQ